MPCSKLTSSPEPSIQDSYILTEPVQVIRCPIRSPSGTMKPSFGKRYDSIFCREGYRRFDALRYGSCEAVVTEFAGDFFGEVVLGDGKCVGKDAACTIDDLVMRDLGDGTVRSSGVRAVTEAGW